jgi:hypothetical protein
MSGKEQYQLEEYIVLGQMQRVDGLWEDVEVPRTKEGPETSDSPMTPAEWLVELGKQKLTGMYRAFTANGKLFQIDVYQIARIETRITRIQ